MGEDALKEKAVYSLLQDKEHLGRDRLIYTNTVPARCRVLSDIESLSGAWDDDEIT